MATREKNVEKTSKFEKDVIFDSSVKNTKNYEKGVIFDLDGTLIDSIPTHYRVNKKIYEHYDIHISKHDFNTKFVGKKPEQIFEELLLEKGKSKTWIKKEMPKLVKLKYKMYEKYGGNTKLFPHVKSTLKNLKKDGYGIVLASSSHKEYVHNILENTGIKDYFEHIVTGSDVEHSKPNPKIFLIARQMLGALKRNCVIIEDAINGVLAAKRAAIPCLCLTTTESKDEIPSYAKVVDSHKNLYDDIRKVLK